MSRVGSAWQLQAEWFGNGDPWPLEPPAGQQPPEEPQHVPGRRVWRGSVVCAATEGVLGGVLACLGNGIPDRGDQLMRSGLIFDDVSAQIAALVPCDDWQGFAAQAYTAQNLAQSQHASTMSDHDHQIGDLISAQAEAIQRTRCVVIAAMGAVASTLAYCVYAETTLGPAGLTLSLKVSLAVCGLAIAFVAGFLTDLAVETSRNESEARVGTQRLTEMLTRLPALSGRISGSPDAGFLPSPSEHHTLPATIEGLLDFKAPLPQTPDVSMVFATLPGSPRFRVPGLPTSGLPDFGVPELLTPHLAGMPSLPDLFLGCMPGEPTAAELAALPDLSKPLAALPRLGSARPSAKAQLAAPLRQLAGVSGAASALSQLTTTAGKQGTLTFTTPLHDVQQQPNPPNHVKQVHGTTGASAHRPDGAIAHAQEP